MALRGIPSIAPHRAAGKPTGSTNLCTNGGFDTNTTGWGGTQANVARVTTGALVGSGALKVTYTAGGTYYRAFSPVASITGASNGRTFTLSGFVKGEGDSIGLALKVYANVFGGAGGELSGSDAFTLTAAWQRVLFTYTVVAADQTSIQAFFQRETDAPVAAEFFYIDAAQIEEQPFATPYIPTDGGTAARTASLVVAP